MLGEMDAVSSESMRYTAIKIGSQPALSRP